MSDPLVSVLIPMYNHDKYIRECLDSVLNEGWTNLEVLIVDDGSKDESYQIAQQWFSEHQEVFVRFELVKQENQGLTKTLNKLIAMAQGEYVTLLASDDMLISGGVQARVKALEKHPHWLAVFGDCTVIDSDGKQIFSSGISELWDRPARKDSLLNKKLLPYEIVLHWTIPGPVLMLRRSTFDCIGYYDEQLIVEDRDFYLRLALQGYLGFTDVLVAKYRTHPTNSYRDDIRYTLAKKAMAISAYRNLDVTKGYLRLVVAIDGYKYNTYYYRLSSKGWQRFFWRCCNLMVKVIWRLFDLGYEGYRFWVLRIKAA
jgi:glycosyltransferase involved in cell wall biosynthesis